MAATDSACSLPLVGDHPTPNMTATPKTTSWKDYVRVTTVGFAGVHVAAVVCAIIWWSWSGVALALATYFVRMIIVTGAYHRYFSHRSFKTSRPFQFVLALLAQTAGQKGVIWWASHHRWHHKMSDTARDVHSPGQRGLWYSHVGWILSNSWNETDPGLVKDLERFPELRFLNHGAMEIVPIAIFGTLMFFFAGMHAYVWGFLVSSVLVWHGSFCINSLAHLIGRRRYATTDDSRNSFILALVTTGEGWHNNHHHYPSAARQGFRWWEIDVTYYVLCALEKVGLVWDLRQPTAAALAGPLVATVDEPPASGRLAAG